MSEAEKGPGEELERLLFGIRPRLHRFCARMLGSAIDGEDVAQDAVLKALEAFPRQSGIVNFTSVMRPADGWTWPRSWAPR